MFKKTLGNTAIESEIRYLLSCITIPAQFLFVFCTFSGTDFTEMEKKSNGKVIVYQGREDIIIIGYVP